MKFPSPGAERVARALHDGGPATASALAQRLGLSPAVVRRHLDSLVSADLVAAAEEPPFGPRPVRGRGRPARTFALTDAGSHAFDLDYDDLAAGALRYLGEVGGDEAIVGFARRRVADWTTHVGERIVARAELPDRVEALAAALSEGGYAATIEQGHPRGVQLCQHHCPVAHVAAEFPQLCEAETEAFADLLGTHVMRLATIAHGDGVCTTLIPDDMTRRSPA